MARPYRIRLTSEEVETLARELLNGPMAPFGVEGFDVVEERDFDGEDVIRVAVRVRDKVPVKIVIDASDKLQQALRAEGEDRWLYLGSKRSEGDEAEEDVE